MNVNGWVDGWPLRLEGEEAWVSQACRSLSKQCIEKAWAMESDLKTRHSLHGA